MDFASVTSLIEYHRSMVFDVMRTETYRRAIAETVNPGDIVVDVGSGTGILAYFACQAGAARVYAIEAGDVVQLARMLCDANGLGDRVTFINELSYLVDLPERADVLVTETLWNFGIGEGLIGFIEDARERFLKPGARIVPQAVELVAAAVEAPELYARIDGWNGEFGYGLDLSPVRELAVNNLYQANLSPNALLSRPLSVAHVELGAESPPDVVGEVNTRVQRPGVLHGLAGWFRAHLSPSLTLSNEPPRRTPSWCQTFFPLERPVEVEEGQEIHVRLQTAANGSIWSWNTRVASADGSSHTSSFEQSTFWGFPKSPDLLEKRTLRSVPRLSRKGEAQAFVLSCLDGSRSLAAVEQELCARFEDLFPRRRDASSYLRDIAERFT